MSEKNKELARKIRELSREIDLESDVPFGSLRSKSWDGKKSNRQSRKDTRRNLEKTVRDGSFEDYEEE